MEKIKEDTKWLLLFEDGTFISECRGEEPPREMRFYTGDIKLDGDYNMAQFDDRYTIKAKSDGKSGLGVVFYH